MSEKNKVLDYVVAEYVLNRFYDWLEDNISSEKTLQQVDEYIEYFLKFVEGGERHW